MGTVTESLVTDYQLIKTQRLNAEWHGFCHFLLFVAILSFYTLF
jgi:hypothetical protein